MIDDKKGAKDLFAEIGFSEEKCLKCSAHLFPTEEGKLICLNACHLSPESRSRFNAMMQAISDEQKQVTIEDQCHYLECSKKATHETVVEGSDGSKYWTLACSSHKGPNARSIADGKSKLHP